MIALLAAATAVLPRGAAAAAGPAPIAVNPFQGYSSLLTRAPYLTDLTQTSVEVTWASNSNRPGYLQWGPAGDCTAYHTPIAASLPPSVPASSTSPDVTSRQFTVLSTGEYQSAVELSGLTPSSSYCYRPFGYTYVGIVKTPVDLLGSNPTPTFTTLDPVSNSSSAPLSFDVVGDTGENLANPNLPFPDPSAQNPNYINPDQAAIDSLIGQSGARFVVLAGDVAYPSGLQDRYGDLQQTGSASNPDVSNMFGPYYWPQTSGLPAFIATGNHGGDNVDELRIWPENATATASNGVEGPVAYPSIDGSAPETYPNEWYAVSSGNVRIYVLQAAWPDLNAGTAPGGPYQVDDQAHWLANDAEYEWLQQDLASHPGGIKFAIWHYPLRSDSPSELPDTYLQNSTANPNGAQNSLEALLAENGVYIAFNAHAHTYQRFDPSGPGQVINYVTGGGGGIPGSVSCTEVAGITSAYALGWSPTTLPGTGSSCGVTNGVADNSAPVPQSAAQVYNFLKVTVQGSQVTVSPTNAAGQVFDQQVYQFGNAAPEQVSQATGTAEPSAVSLSWTPPANEAASASTSYVIHPYRSGSPLPLINTGSAKTSYAVTGLTNGDSYTFQVAGVNDYGIGPVSPMSAAVVPAAPSPANYTAVTPYRICDTRGGNPSNLAGVDAQCNGMTLGPGGQLTIQVGGTNPSGTSSGGVPSTATAVVLNVTATDTTAPSYLTVWPGGVAMPLASSVNWSPGQTVANLVTVDLASNGSINVYNDNGNADLVVDVEGWLGTSAPSGGYYVPLASPYRVCDTRNGNPSRLSGQDAQCAGHTLQGNTTLTVGVAGSNPSGSGSGGVPASGALAVDLTVTATDTTAPSYLTVWPAGAPQPLASNLNFTGGQTVPNNVVVLLPASAPGAGAINIYNANGSADVVVDVSGYYTSTPVSGSSLFTPMVPYRICDTRPTYISGLVDACTGSSLQGGQAYKLQVTGVGGIPAGIKAVVLNVTATDTSAPDYLTVYPDGATRPLVSSLNWLPGQTVASGMVVTLSGSGALDFYIPQGAADLVVDVVGWEQ